MRAKYLIYGTDENGGKILSCSVSVNSISPTSSHSHTFSGVYFLISNIMLLNSLKHNLVIMGSIIGFAEMWSSCCLCSKSQQIIKSLVEMEGSMLKFLLLT